MDEKLQKLENTVNSLTAELGHLKELISGGFKKVDSNFESIKKEIDSLHKKIDFANKKIDLLEGTTSDGFGDVGVKIESLTEEISKIGAVTKYDEQFKNLEGMN